MKSGTEINIDLLLRQLKQGSEPAFNTLYLQHSRILLSNIRNLVKDNEVAKELLQDLYLKVWENRGSIDPEKSFKSFLFVMARNMVYDDFRRVSLDKRAKISLMNIALQKAYADCNHLEASLCLSVFMSSLSFRSTTRA